MPRAGHGFDERRAAMAEAAGRLLRDEGPGAVTHRRVAIEAGIPVGSANHLYRTRAELYRAAVESAEAERYAEAAELVAGLPERIEGLGEVARLLLVAWYSPGRPEELLAMRVEPMLLAAMDPATRDIMHRTKARLAPLLDEIVVRGGLGGTAIADLVPDLALGAITHAATSGADDVMAEATGALTRILEALRG